MFSGYSEIPLPVCCGERYKGLAFDGCQYYLTIRCACQIAVLDCNFRPVRQVETRRPYTAICYDFNRDCFWAAAEQRPATIFKLDSRFQEIDALPIRLEGCCIGLISGLSFCCENGLLVASTGNKIVEIGPENAEVRLLQEDRKDALILSVACLPPYIIFCVLRDRKPYLVLSTCTGTLLEQAQKPIEHVADDILFYPCGGMPDECSLLLLTNKHGCYPYLLQTLLEEEVCRDLCPCNREICCKCEEACCPCCSNACTDIFESIALQMAAIAHILNAEGEKLQKVIEESATPRELLEVNESVQKTIVYVTQLEQALFCKLDTLQEICCACGE